MAFLTGCLTRQNLSESDLVTVLELTGTKEASFTGYYIVNGLCLPSLTFALGDVRTRMKSRSNSDRSPV